MVVGNEHRPYVLPLGKMLSLHIARLRTPVTAKQLRNLGSMRGEGLMPTLDSPGGFQPSLGSGNVPHGRRALGEEMGGGKFSTAHLVDSDSAAVCSIVRLRDHNWNVGSNHG